MSEYKELKSKAEQGDVDSQYELGCYYYNKQAEENNEGHFVEAAIWWGKAMMQHPSAMNDLANLHFEIVAEHPDFNADIAEASNAMGVDFLGFSIEKGLMLKELFVSMMDNHPIPSIELGVLYYKGERGVPSDPQKGLALIDKALEKGANDDLPYDTRLQIGTMFALMKTDDSGWDYERIGKGVEILESLLVGDAKKFVHEAVGDEGLEMMEEGLSFSREILAGR